MSTLPLFSTSPLTGFVPPTLRPYQKHAIDVLRARWSEGIRRPMLVLPTSAGKTVIFAALIRGASVPCLFAAHRKELIDQAYNKLRAQGLSHIGVMRGADDRYDPSATIQVASIQTLARRDKPKAGIIFIDECHRGASDSYREHIFDAYPDAFIIGLTATPTRLDNRPLGDLFQTMDVIVTYAELIKKEWLLEPTCFGWEPPDLSQVPMSGSDWQEGPLEHVMNESKLVGDIVDHWKRLAVLPDGTYRRTFAFATGIAHSKSIVERFRAEYFRAEHLDGETPEPIRDATLEALAAGELDIVSNCNILLEGVDIPQVKCVIHARPTQSIVLWRQSTGRMTRPWCFECDAAECRATPKHPRVAPLLLDHAGNYDRHGAPTEDIRWQLKTRHTRISGSAPEKRCPACGLYCLAGRYTCPHCGHEFDMSRASAPKSEGDGQLALKDPALVRRAFYDKMVSVARARGFKPGWPGIRFKERYGEWPDRAWSDATKVTFATDEMWTDAVERRRKEKEATDGDPAMDVGADPAGLAGPPEEPEETLSGWLEEQGIGT